MRKIESRAEEHLDYVVFEHYVTGTLRDVILVHLHHFIECFTMPNFIFSHIGHFHLIFTMTISHIEQIQDAFSMCKLR